jgi:hypothetical protein
LLRKVFISHSIRDKELADLVQGLIESGVGVPHHDVFCTSLEGLGIPEGTPDFKEKIRAELEGCDTVVALISPNYYASPFCMCELGAVWALAKNFFPILVPPVDFKDLRGALAGMQCRKLEDQSTASALYTRLSKLVAIAVPVERWDVKKEVFYRSLPNVLAGLPKPETVSVDELNRAKQERDGFKTLSVKLEEECNQVKRQNAELAAAKDATAVNEILKKYSCEWDQFQGLIETSRLAIRGCPRVVREALFYWARNEAFAPGPEWEEDVTKALENDMLKEHEFEEYKFWPNKERPVVNAAMESISDLKEFLDHDCTEQFYKEATIQLGDTPDMKRRSFWERQLWR